MNDGTEQRENENMLFICLKGRIPVKIKGKCKKGDYIIAQEGGVGKADIYDPHKHDLIGIALTDSNNGLTEVKV